jgi:hypothetical protein
LGPKGVEYSRSTLELISAPATLISAPEMLAPAQSGPTFLEAAGRMSGEGLLEQDVGVLAAGQHGLAASGRGQTPFRVDALGSLGVEPQQSPRLVMVAAPDKRLYQVCPVRNDADLLETDLRGDVLALQQRSHSRVRPSRAQVAQPGCVVGHQAHEYMPK